MSDVQVKRLASPYIEALNDIARALRGRPDGETVVWNVEQLPGQVERELTHLRVENRKLRRKVERLQEERDDALARAAQAEAEVAELRGVLYRAGVNTHTACCEGRDHAPACQEIEDALSSPSPVAEAMGRVVEAVGVEYDSPHLKSHLCEECELDEVLTITLESHDATMNAYHALQSARSGRGEGE